MKKVWKYAKHGQTNELGLIKSNRHEEPTITFKKENIFLRSEYDQNIKIFKRADRNYPKFMYETLTRLLEIGKELDKDFTIIQLCRDLDITYERYKYYMKYELLTDDMKYLIQKGDIKQDSLMNIIHRFPKEDWKYLIEKQIKFKLSKNELVDLRKNNAYKNEKNWIKKFDERNITNCKHSTSNKRSIYIWCKRLLNELDDLQCFNNPTKKKVYKNIYDTNNKLSKWLKKHEEWK